MSVKHRGGGGYISEVSSQKIPLSVMKWILDGPQGNEIYIHKEKSWRVMDFNNDIYSICHYTHSEGDPIGWFQLPVNIHTPPPPYGRENLCAQV